MTLELTKDQAVVYLHDLSGVLNALAITLHEAAELAHRTPAASVPTGILDALVGSWESLDSRFREVYTAVYGSYPKDDDQANGSCPKASLG